ncbi:hypothetical protein HPY28_00295 [Brevibacillus sp. HB1.2]|uniref:hypothetical protein n=1 Tax=Brevibacillus sp. HB1.2 TaxID=2738807 RepID=UPI0015755507|nr:hypothetical protein [Brevibacillus sp. HB1.2]NTU18758.1 hypothetical protein [Brevibacillus sp. HB1.2]
MPDGDKLSETAKAFIRQCTRRETITDREQVKKILQQHGIPAFNALLDVQEKYGGLSYSFGGEIDNSFCIDIWGDFAHRDGEECRLPAVLNYEGQMVVACFHVMDDRLSKAGYIDEDGRLYTLHYTKFQVIAENIEELLESESVKYSLLREKKQWIVKWIEQSDVAHWLSSIEQKPILIEQASQGYQKWWKSHDGRLYVHVRNGSGIYAVAYAMEVADLTQLGLSSYSILRGFPFDCSYQYDRECAEVKNTMEMFHFQSRLYRTCDYSRITVPQVKEAKDIYLYVTGQKTYERERPIEDFLLKFPGLVLPIEDFDQSLLEFALCNGDERILKLITYIASLANHHHHRSTSAENNVDHLLFHEYLRRIHVFIEAHPMNVHPLYFHPYRAAGVPAELDIDEKNTVVTRMRGNHAQTVSKLTLYYMTCAKEGNEIAAHIYRIYEPMLLLYALEGSIRVDHGLIEVGGSAFHPSSWQARAGKDPFDVYHRTAEAWKNRNVEYAIDQIKRVKWDKKIGNTVERGFGMAKRNDETLKAAFTHLESRLGKDLSESPLASDHTERILAKLSHDYLLLQTDEGAVAYLICQRYLGWAHLVDRKHPVATKSPCLYEPFIEILYEEEQIEKWERKTMNLIRLMEQESIEKYAEVLRKQKD